MAARPPPVCLEVLARAMPGAGLPVPVLELVLGYSPVSQQEALDYLHFVRGAWHRISDPVRQAARNGSLGLLKWAVICGAERRPEFASTLAAGGNLALLRWAHARGLFSRRPSSGVDVCRGAAGGGHFAALWWAREAGLAWDAQTCAAAAGGGHLELLQWLRAEGAPWDERASEAAAAGGHLAVLEWILSSDKPPWDAVRVGGRAASTGQLDVLRWLHQRGFPKNKHVVLIAAHRCDTHLLAWAVSAGWPRGPGDTCRSVDEGGGLPDYGGYSRADLEAYLNTFHWVHVRAGLCPSDARSNCMIHLRDSVHFLGCRRVDHKRRMFGWKCPHIESVFDSLIDGKMISIQTLLACWDEFLAELRRAAAECEAALVVVW